MKTKMNNNYKLFNLKYNHKKNKYYFCYKFLEECDKMTEKEFLDIIFCKYIFKPGRINDKILIPNVHCYLFEEFIIKKFSYIPYFSDRLFRFSPYIDLMAGKRVDFTDLWNKDFVKKLPLTKMILPTIGQTDMMKENFEKIWNEIYINHKNSKTGRIYISLNRNIIIPIWIESARKNNILI